MQLWLFIPGPASLQDRPENERNSLTNLKETPARNADRSAEQGICAAQDLFWLNAECFFTQPIALAILPIRYYWVTLATPLRPCPYLIDSKPMTLARKGEGQKALFAGPRQARKITKK